jgi:hypothetical protein
MATKTRLYRVKSRTDVHLVEASTPRGALAYVARNEFTVDIPAQHEVFAMAKAGVEIEIAGEDTVSEETRAAISQSTIESAIQNEVTQGPKEYSHG